LQRERKAKLVTKRAKRHKDHEELHQEPKRSKASKYWATGLEKHGNGNGGYRKLGVKSFYKHLLQRDTIVVAVVLVLMGTALYSVILQRKAVREVDRMSAVFSVAFRPIINVDDISVNSKFDNGKPRLSIKFGVKNLGNVVANDLSVIVSTWVDKKNWIDKENPKMKQSSASLLFPGNGLTVESDIYTSNEQYGKEGERKLLEEIQSKEILCQIIVKYVNKAGYKDYNYRSLFKLNPFTKVLTAIQKETY
jgi:hypothetical protein